MGSAATRRPVVRVLVVPVGDDAVVAGGGGGGGGGVRPADTQCVARRPAGCPALVVGDYVFL